MNLHAIVRGAITIVNQDVPATLRRSTGNTIAPDGTLIPSYADTVGIPVQVQAVSSSDIRQLDGLNIQGIRRVAYLNGSAMGVVRNLQVGGDLFIFAPGTLPEGDTWLVAHVMEQWGPGSEWCKCALTLQVGP